MTVEVRAPAPAQTRVRTVRAVAVVAAVWVLAFAMIAAVFAIRDQLAGDRFDLVRWERTTIWNKWLFHAGTPLRNDPPADEAIRRYFAFADRTTPDAVALESVVERAIEGRINAVLMDLGLTARGIRLPGSVFPPVAIELATPPRVLIQSPRDEIRRMHVELLRTDLTTADVIEIERRIEARHTDRSALIVGAGGLATYPAAVSARGSYESTVATAAHEWAHHYLVFYPLGFRYFASGDIVTINETVADVIGEEVARLVIERFGDPTLPQPPPLPIESDEEAAEAPERFDYFPVLRELRLEVDVLLARGAVTQAELRMEAVQEELQREGIFFRRINQAFFAWFGSYAARPDSVDPIGPQLFEIRERAGTLPEFVRLIRGVSSRGEVGALLEALRERDGALGTEVPEPGAEIPGT